MSETTAPAPAAAPTSSVNPSSSGMPPSPIVGAKGGQSNDQTASQPAAPKVPELYDYKINGKQVRLTAEQRDEYVSMGHLSTQRLQEAAEIKKRAEDALGEIRDPKKLMKALQNPALGYSKEQIREAMEEWYNQEFIEPEKLTPEQRELKAARAELQRHKDAEAERDAEKQRNEQDAMTTQARETLQAQIVEALDSSTLPKTNFTIRRLAYWMQRAGKDASIPAVVGMVRNELHQNMREMVEASDGDVLIKLLGDNVIKKLRTYDLEQLRKTRGGGQPPTADAPAAHGSVSPGTPRKERERAPTSSDVTQKLRTMARTGRY